MSEQLLRDGKLGVIRSIEEVHGYQVRPLGPMKGSSGAQSGFSQNLNRLMGHTSTEGFKVTTDKHVLLVLIDDESSCCESWGHIHSADDLDDFVGARLKEIRLTDTALNSTIVERSGEYGFDAGGIQFVDLLTSKGKLQLAVYNSHNGYYGHGIVIALDNEVLAEDTL